MQDNRNTSQSALNVRPVSISSAQDIKKSRSEVSEDIWAALALVILIGAIVAFGILFLVPLSAYTYIIVNGVGLLGIVLGDIFVSISNKRASRGSGKRTFLNKAANLLRRIIAIAFLAYLLYYIISIL